MCCYRPIQAALQSSTIYRVRLCFLLDVSLFTFTRGLTTKTNILFGIQKTFGTSRGKTEALLHSISITYSKIIQTGWSFIELHRGMRQCRTIPQTLKFISPSPLSPLEETKVALGPGWGASALLSKGQDRAQKGIRHHTEWFVFLPPAHCFANPAGAVSTDRAQSPWKGPAWEKRMFCTELSHVWAQPAWKKLKFIKTLVAK